MAMRKKPWGVVETPGFHAGRTAAPLDARAAWEEWASRAAEVLDLAGSIEDAMDDLGLDVVPACFAEEPEQPYPVSLVLGASTIVAMRIDSENRRLILTAFLTVEP